MFLLQAHPSSCSQQDPTWLCLPSRPMATATQEHQATASHHSPPSVMACDHPTTPDPRHNSTQHFPSICLSLFVFLTSFPWSSTHKRGHKRATDHSHFEYYFFIMLSCYKRKHLTAMRDFYLYCSKEIGPCFFTFHIYDYLFRIFCVYINVMFFFIIGLWFVRKWTC